MKPYFEAEIEPELKDGKTVLIAAHGNSLRAIVKMLDGLTEEEIAKVNIPTAIPLVYELDENFKPIKKGGEYLDPEAAAAGAAAVAAQARSEPRSEFGGPPLTTRLNRMRRLGVFRTGSPFACLVAAMIAKATI